MKRLFFALWPDARTRQLIVNFKQSIKSDRLKQVKADNLHVTLLFLGNIDNKSEALIRKNVVNIDVEAFSLNFSQLSYWRKPRVLCLTTEQYSEQLLILVDALKNRAALCGITTEDRPYKPHITLARKAVSDVSVDVQPITWQAEVFCLVESVNTADGVHYRVLQSWNF